MTKEDARELIARYGAKQAKLVLLERRAVESDAQAGQLRSEIVKMREHVGTAAAILEDDDV